MALDGRVQSFLFYNEVNKILFGVIYSVNCLMTLYIVHYTWKNKYSIKYFVIFLPLFYFYLVQTAEKYFLCKNKNTIRLFISVPLNFIKKLKVFLSSC